MRNISQQLEVIQNMRTPLGTPPVTGMNAIDAMRSQSRNLPFDAYK
jgi:hypothetical protein